MLCDKGLELVKEAKRSLDGHMMLPYNGDLVRLVVEEINSLFENNQRDVAAMNVSSGEDTVGQQRAVAVWVRHAAIQRNRRCLLAYLWQRARRVSELRWSFGSAVPSDVRESLSDSENSWLSDYGRCLGKYMRSLGSAGLDLTVNRKPPKHLYIEVRVVDDYGEFETDDGELVMLKKNSVHLLPRAQCEHLIQLGVLEHVVH